MNLKSKAVTLVKDDLIIDTAIVFLGTSLGGFFSLLYHMISVRLLSYEDYGTFNALISLVMVSTMTFNPMGTTLTRFFTEHIARRNFAALNFVFIRLIKRFFIAGIISFLVFSVFASPLARFLKTHPHYLIICGGIIALSLFSLPVSPFFQSFQKFGTYSLIGILSAFGKLIFGGLLMFIGWGILGGLSGFLVATLLILLVGIFVIPAVFKNEIGPVANNPDPVAASLVPMYKYFFPVSVAIFSFTLLTNIDVILVKHFFSALDAGYYSTAQMVGKVVLYLPSAMAIVILPKGTESHVTNSNPNGLLYKSLTLAAVLCGLISISCFLFPGFVLRVIAAKANPVSGNLVGMFALAMGFYALLLITVNFLLGTHNLKFVLPLALVAVLEGAFIYCFHPTLKTVVLIFLTFSIISFLVSFWVVMASGRKGVAADAPRYS